MKISNAPEGYHYMANGELMQNHETQQTTSTLKNYLPLITVFGYIFLGSILLTFRFNPTIGNQSVDMNWMTNFMGIWFIVFSLFKMIDLSGFASGYSTYDIIAKKFAAWGYIFPFIELGIGVAYLSRLDMIITSIFTLVILSIASVGVIQSVLKHEKIQCACLGTVLKVPLTQVTLGEDLLMVAMTIAMLTMK